MALLHNLKFILNHPLNRKNKINAIWRIVKWQINTKINPYPVVLNYAEKSKFLAWKGLTGATGNLYCGLHEFEDMGFALHFLRSTDTFIDIGANVGSYTILAASEVAANTISIEPIPSTFATLKSNVAINNVQERVTALNMGLGAEKGILKFTKSLDSTNHVATEDEKDTIDVPIDNFDNIIKLENPALIKIDVEGFETEVLNGMENSLANKNLKAIIIELNGAGKRYGYSEDLIHEKILKNGFIPHLYDPILRKLKQIENHGRHNTIYIKDIDFVGERLKSAKKFTIKSHNQKI